MAFHTTIWLDNYTDYVTFLMDITSVSNLQDYSIMEYNDMYPGMAARADALS